MYIRIYNGWWIFMNPPMNTRVELVCHTISRDEFIRPATNICLFVGNIVSCSII